MTMPDRIPLPEGVTPPFVAHNCRVTGGNGGHFLTNPSLAPWIARVLTAYYADPPSRESVPQFVVVKLLPQGEAIVSTFGMFAVNNGAQCYCHDERITTAEYAHLKSILAPGQGGDA